jgi:hypothetical protein
MENVNPIHNRFMKLALYVNKRRNGVTVFVRRKLHVVADPKTGESQWTIKTWRIKRVVILPATYRREAKMNAGAMAANRAIVQGGGYDTSVRHFILDRHEVPSDLDLKKDDWIAFNDKHYDVESVVDYEFGAAWLVSAKELKGRLEVIDEIHNPLHLNLDVADQLVIDDEIHNPSNRNLGVTDQLVINDSPQKQ